MIQKDFRKVYIFIFGILNLAICTAMSTTSSSSSPTSISTPVNQFAAKVYSELAKENKKFVFSPASLHIALSMCLAGASDGNYVEMNKVLFEETFGSDRNSSLTPILSGMKTLMESYCTTSGSTKLKLANGFFTSPNYDFSNAYKSLLSSTFSAKMQNQLSAQVINSFVEQATDKVIKNLVQPSMITPETVSVLVNAIYFKGSWVHPFKKELTNEQGTFTKFDNTVATAPMMKARGLKERDVYYGEHDWNDTKFQSLTLPYEGGSFSMVFLLPSESSEQAFDKLNQGLFHEKQLNLLQSIKQEQRNNVKLNIVQIPRFKLESTHKLNKNLKNIGMKQAFSQGGFQNMTDQQNNLLIDFVIQKAFLEVNEKGTVAAAATAVGMKFGSVRRTEENVQFVLDRPFVCLLKHEATDTIAFAAQVTSL